MTKITEQRNILSENLDNLDPIEILQIINSEDAILHKSIEKMRRTLMQAYGGLWGP